MVFCRLVFFILAVVVSASQVKAQSPLALGGGAGIELPFAHEGHYEAGVAAEAYWRKDPYELRFHFSDVKTRTYSLLVGIKHFFTNAALRPFIAGGLGPTIVQSPGRDLAYGFRPDVTLGADLGLSRNLSFGVATKYFGLVYWGDTESGKMEANHGLNIMVNFAVWF